MADRKKKLSGSQYRKRRAEKEQGKQEGSFLKYLRPQHRDDEGSSTSKIQPETETETTVLSTASQADKEYEEHTEDVEEEHTEDVEEEHTEDVEEEHTEDVEEDHTEDVEEEPCEVQLDQEVIQSESSSSFSYSDPATWIKCDDNLRQILVEHGPEQVQQFKFPKDANKRRFLTNHYKRRLPNGDLMHRQWLQYSVSNDSVFCFCCKLFGNYTNLPSSLSDKGSKDWKNITAILSQHERSNAHLVNFQNWKELEIRLKNKKTIDEEHMRIIKQKEKYWQQILERLIALVRVLGIQNLAFRGTNEKLHTAGNGNFLKFIEYLALFDPVMDEHIRKIRDKETYVHYLGKDIQNELIQLLSNIIKEEILKSAQVAKYFSIIIDCTPDVSHVEQMTMILRFVNIASLTDDCEPVRIKEHFLGFLPLKETTGAGMTEIILHQLEEMSLPVANLRGQGYDNGSNMKGKENGLGDIYDALFEIYNDNTLTGASGNTSRIEAQGLAKGISNFKFVISLVVWYGILFEVNMTSKQLQTKEFDIHNAIKQLNETKKFLADCRSDEGFGKVLEEAGELAEALGIPAQFEVDPVRISRKRKQFIYEAEDAPIQNPKEKFKVNFYFAVLDTAVQSVEDEFTQMKQISSVFGFLYNVHSLQNRTSQQIMEDCCKLEQALQHGDSKDIDASDLCSELQSIARRVPECTSPQDVFNFLCKNELIDVVPNTCIALRILLTLPVSVASGERSFSKLKLIKTYIRSSMMQERLVGLSLLSIEHEIAQKVDLKELVSKFAKLKARKMFEPVVLGGRDMNSEEDLQILVDSFRAPVGLRMIRCRKF
ncbi:zinc finger MYM-type protein 1-like [Pseudophryne corroboree]|uniref:zinc finger MYM-type protein 1-like n=1 Tax=Pseudophryne corroboree TaxID=495146 RepID=UPI00308152C2